MTLWNRFSNPLAPNPKVPVSFAMADGSHFRDMLAEILANPRMAQRMEQHGIPLAGATGYPFVFWGTHSTYLWLRPGSRTIWLRHPLEDLTQAHVVRQIADEVPVLRDWRLWRFEALLGGYRWTGHDLGMTLGQYRDRMKHVAQRLPSVRRHGELQPRRYDYWRYATPGQREWFHATLKRHLPSIRAHGLRPSRPGVGGGWSPHWNIGLSRAVYLTADIDFAARIAETLVGNFSEDAVVLRVDGRALTDLTRLRVDEDVLRGEDGGIGLNWGMIDADFPDYETSWHGYRGRSIGYAGTIPPRLVSVALNLHLAVERSEVGEERYDEDVTWHVDVSGPRLAQYEAER